MISADEEILSACQKRSYCVTIRLLGANISSFLTAAKCLDPSWKLKKCDGRIAGWGAQIGKMQKPSKTV